jgi:hypothetical protein
MNRRSRRIDFTHDFLANSQSFRINDIDLPLINYGFICRQDFSDYSNGRRNIRFQSYESFLLIVSYIFNVIRYIFYIIDSVDGRVPDNYLDIVQYFAGITQFNRFEIVCALISSLIIVIHFIYSNDLNWIEIIEALKGSQSTARIGIHGKDRIHEISYPDSSLLFIIFCTFNVSCDHNYFYDFKNIFKCGIFSSILYNTMILTVFPIL